MKKVLSYFQRTGVDTILLLATICVAIKQYNVNDFAFALACFYSLYIFGTIFRMGQATDLINDYIWDKQVRRDLNLSSIPGEHYKEKLTTFAKIVKAIFVLGTIGILVAFLLGA
jgi:hypothetical protein